MLAVAGSSPHHTARSSEDTNSGQGLEVQDWGLVILAASRSDEEGVPTAGGCLHVDAIAHAIFWKPVPGRLLPRRSRERIPPDLPYSPTPPVGTRPHVAQAEGILHSPSTPRLDRSLPAMIGPRLCEEWRFCFPWT